MSKIKATNIGEEIKTNLKGFQMEAWRDTILQFEYYFSEKQGAMNYKEEHAPLVRGVYTTKSSR